MFRRHHFHLAWHLTVHTYMVLTWAVLIAGFAFAALMLGVRYYVLPDIDRYRPWIESGVSRAVGQRVTIGRASGAWSGYRPSLKLDGIVVYDRENRPALELGHVEGTIALRSALLGEVRLHSLIIDRPDLTIRRDPAGVITVAGFVVGADGADGGLGDWLLVQEEIQIRAASLTWIDEKRGAPPLHLDQVDFALTNEGREHRFGLRFSPPAEVGSMVDVRGDFRRSTGQGLARWRGRLYAKTEFIAVSAGKTWIDLPVDVDGGVADVEAWADLAEGAVTRVTADLRVAGLKATLGEGLVPLELAGLQGRLGLTRGTGGFEVSGQRLSLALANGTALGPTDWLFRRQPASGNQPASYQVEADRIDLATLAAIAGSLPFDAAWRERLAQARPQGRVQDLRLAWDTESIKSGRLDLQATLREVGMAPNGTMPGMSGLSGRIVSDRNGGKVEVDSAGLVLAMPAAFERPLAFDTFKAQVDWSRANGPLAVRVGRLVFANAEVSGGVSGTYERGTEGPGRIDLTVLLTRFEAGAIVHYVPLRVGPNTRLWLANAFEAGVARDVKGRLQGNLADFPYDKPGKTGIFEITANLEGIKLRFAPGWPTVDDANGTIHFRGARMEVDAVGRIMGVALGRTVSVIPELSPHDPMLEIKGGGEGETQAFLDFVDASPVGRMIGGVTRGLRAQGRGKLDLELRIPLDRGRDTKVAGSYQFVDNRIAGSETIPDMTNLNALLAFSEDGAKLTNGTATIFDGPTRFSVTTEAGGAVTVNANGRANMARLQRALGTGWLAYAEGDTDWKARAMMRKGASEMSLESELAGVALKLPPPLAKAAQEAVSLRLQRRVRPGEEVVQLSLGQRLSAIFALDPMAKTTKVDRGAIDFGTNAKLPDAAGIVVTGAFDLVDVDAWLDLRDAAHARGNDPPTGFDVVALDLKAKQVEAFGRTLNDVALKVNRKIDLWDGQLTSREVQGDIDWIPGGKGKLVARLARLNVPDPDSEASGTGAEPIAGRDLPAFDVTADSFQFGGLDLGALVLKATPNGPTWQVERLDIRNPDFEFSGTGAWQSVRGTPRTNLAATLKVNDAGAFFRRIKRPEGVAGGKSTLAGNVDWVGVPYRLDYASLNGDLKLDVEKGRFLKLEPGIGRLLGVVSLQSLPRRVSLDFKDVFSEGFAFDSINGTFAIKNGVMHTDDMRMVGSAARVNMKGDVDTVRETQALEVRVVPSISDSVAVGTAIVNPAVGLATFLVGKALKDPLDQFIAFEYKITGGWADPVVAKVQRQPEPVPGRQR
ncbi:MAG: TIGR02099 family protein [Burkholderiales bacterium]|nr:TIGR02099 family protein [Burkholderiales bacterium]